MQQALAPSGTLRVAMNFGNPVLVQRDPATGAPAGVAAALAQALASQLGCPFVFVPYETAGHVTDAVPHDAWDIAFLAVDPRRAEIIDFTAPYVLIEGCYVVPAASPIRTASDVDRDDVQVMVDRGSAYDLHLTRTLQHATLVRPPGVNAAAAYLAHPVDVLAGVRQPLEALVAAHPDLRLLPGRFMQIEQAMATPKGRGTNAAYLHRFVEEAKASGFVARALAESGQAAAVVAPPSP